VIHKRGAPVPVVDQVALDARFFGAHHLALVKGNALRGHFRREQLPLRGSPLDFLMVAFLAPGHDVEQVVAPWPGIQFQHGPARVRLPEGVERRATQDDLLSAVLVEVEAADGQRRAFAFGQRLGFDQVGIVGHAEVEQIHAAEQPVPVGVVGLGAPQQVERARLVWPFGHGVHFLSHHPHAFVHVVHLVVLDHEVAPHAAAQIAQHILATRCLHLRLDSLQLAETGRGQRPLPHLEVAGRGQVDAAQRGELRKVVHRADRMQPIRVPLQRGEERLHILPAAPVVLVGARPHAELLAVVAHQGQLGRGAGCRRVRLAAQPVEQVGHRVPGDGVAQVRQGGKDAHRVALLLADEVAE